LRHNQAVRLLQMAQVHRNTVACLRFIQNI
jgi:hypothetical protein